MTSDAMARSIDPELWVSVRDLGSPDLGDVDAARAAMSSSELPMDTAEARFGSRVDVDHVTVSGSMGDVRVRVSVPRSGPVRGAILLLHGGAFLGGDAASEHARTLRIVSESSCAVISPEYRLAPEDPYPAAFDDCAAVLDWVSAQFGTGAADVPIVVAGVSAGAALAAGIALRARDQAAPALAGLMLLFPVLDDRMTTTSMRRFVGTPVWDSASSALMWQRYLGHNVADAYAAPARAESLRGLPPTYLSIAELDPLRDEALEFAGHLLDDGVSVDVRLWARTVHVFDQLAPDATVSERSLDDQVQFVRRVVGARRSP